MTRADFIIRDCYATLRNRQIRKELITLGIVSLRIFFIDQELKLQRPSNIHGRLQRVPNTPIQPLRPPNTTNLSIDVFNEIQQYIDLVEGVKSSDLFKRMQGVENITLQDAQFPTSLILGYSFP
ncbi:hypothetical protein C2G38_2166790 [Gigaspora rosea]|uniref:Uncharacterized protein n=1 Tax=Gigaspora rosea TaxID=44941 RepID=A0A397VVR8_9GLOM|nr:hypothetical protein C2G38_2166790 [Gigaspora rosea]